MLTTAAIVELLDDDVVNYSLRAWQKRNVRFYELLLERGLVDASIVSLESLRRLTETLIHYRVGAAIDPQNGGHVRAQNENVVYYGITAHVPKESLTIALTAGFIHDLNKAVGEPLRTDEYAVRDASGDVVPVMTTIAQIVGLNHLGARTQRAIVANLSEEVGASVDRCIVHHGLGSSQFIRDLVDGKNPWWGSEFVDPASGKRRLVHPKQPELSLESVIHDLADSTQQMQGGGAWLMKYPSGYWAASGRSFAAMISSDAYEGDIPMSLKSQMDVESTTCVEIIGNARAKGLIQPDQAEALGDAIGDATAWSRRWIDDSDSTLDNPEGRSVYHDLGQMLEITPRQAQEKLASATPGTSGADQLEELIWESGRRVDSDRAHGLAALIERA